MARGDRRGFVAVDYQGEIYAIAKYTGVRTKQVRARLGDPKELPSIEEAKDKIAAQMSQKLLDHLQQTKKQHRQRSASLAFQRSELVQRQRDKREKLEHAQRQRWDEEARARAQHLAKGLRGIWHRLTGRHAHVKRKNGYETLLAHKRDRTEKDALIFRHIEERQELHKTIREEKKNHTLEIHQLRQDISDYLGMKLRMPTTLKEQFEWASKQRKNRLKRDKARKRDSGFEPEM